MELINIILSASIAFIAAVIAFMTCQGVQIHSKVEKLKDD